MASRVETQLHVFNHFTLSSQSPLYPRHKYDFDTFRVDAGGRGQGGQYGGAGRCDALRAHQTAGIHNRLTTERVAVDVDGLDIPERGTGILHVCGNDDDPDWREVRPRDRPKYLRERHWIRQWSGQRWRRPGVVGMAWRKELRRADIGRSPDDPGDAFFDFGLLTRHFKSLVTVRTWVEVTEVFQPGRATGVNRFVREYNGLRGKGEIDAQDFLRSLDLGLPDARLQRAMADHVLAAVIKKAWKGQEAGPYRSLCLLYTSPSPRDGLLSRMPSSA